MFKSSKTIDRMPESLDDTPGNRKSLFDDVIDDVTGDDVIIGDIRSS